MSGKSGVLVDEASSLHYTGYLRFINDSISQVLLLILAHVLLLSCLQFLLL